MKRAALGSFVLTGLCLLLVLGARPASAHADLLLSTPSDGESLATAPGEIVLTFSEGLLPETVNVSITDGAGALVPAGSPLVEDADVTLPWPTGLPGGAYSVNYRVVSLDGHPVSGTITFDYPAAGPSAVASTTAPEPVPVPAATETDDDSSPGLPLPVVAAGLLSAAAIAGVLLARRRRPTS